LGGARYSPHAFDSLRYEQMRYESAGEERTIAPCQEEREANGLSTVDGQFLGNRVQHNSPSVPPSALLQPFLFPLSRRVSLIVSHIVIFL